MNDTLSKRIYNIAGIRSGPVAAALVFFFVSIYLYAPYLQRLSRVDYFYLIIPAIGGPGCFLLSRCYVRTFAAAVLAGGVYAFGPFVLAFSAYHRFAGIPAAILPWLFIPAVYIRPTKNFLSLANFIKAVFFLLSMAVIPAFFYLAALPPVGPFFPMPLASSEIENLTGVILPLSGSGHEFMYSFYHVPLTAVIFGLMVYVPSGAVGLVILAVTAAALSFGRPVFETPPIAWGLWAVLPCSILAGIGAENLVRARRKFRKRAFVCFIVTAGMAIFAYTKTQTISGAALAFSAVLAGSTIPMSVKPARFRFAVWLIFYIAACADMLWGAAYCLSQIFGY